MSRVWAADNRVNSAKANAVLATKAMQTLDKYDNKDFFSYGLDKEIGDIKKDIGIWRKALKSLGLSTAEANQVQKLLIAKAKAKANIDSDEYIDTWRREGYYTGEDELQARISKYNAAEQKKKEKAQKEKIKGYVKLGKDTPEDPWMPGTASKLYEERAEAQSRALGMMADAEESWSERMINLTENTANKMQDNFSDLFFDVVKGEMTSWRDYMIAIFDSISRAWADMMGQMLAQSIFGKDFKGGGGLDSLIDFGKSLFGFGGGSFKATGASGAFNIGQFGTTAFKMAGGGYLGEDVVGIGRRTGSSYELHANEYVIPPNKLSGGGGGVQNTTVNVNITAFDSKDVQRVLSENKGLIGNLVGGQMMRNQSLRTNVKMASR